MAQKYAFQGSEENTAKAFGRRLAISTKDSVMVCKAIRGKAVARARKILEQAISLERPIRYGRFSEAAGHKPGIGPGRYPVKTAIQILKVLNSAEANAQHKGLGSSLVVEHAAAHQASRGWKFGRQRRRKEKSTHVEIILRASKAPARKAETAEKQQPQAEVKEEKAEKPARKEAEEKKAKPAQEPKETKKESKKAAEAMTTDNEKQANNKNNKNSKESASKSSGAKKEAKK